VGNTLVLHVLHAVEHLDSEKSADVFAHRAIGLAHVEEQLTLHELHREVDEVLEMAARRLNDEAVVTVADHLDDVGLVEFPQNLNFVSEALQVVLRPLDKVLLEDLDCDLLRLNRAVLRNAQVDLGSVALADLLGDIVVVVEDGVLLARQFVRTLHLVEIYFMFYNLRLINLFYLIRDGLSRYLRNKMRCNRWVFDTPYPY
jgi:hypothetical protein